MNNPIVIFDLDGTLSDHTPRLPLALAKQWDLYHAGCVADNPHAPIVRMAQSLAISGQWDIIICTGRDETYRDETIHWLRQHDVPWKMLFMRGREDFRPGTEVKKAHLDWLLVNFYKPMLVVEDQPSLVEFWRGEGICCLAMPAAKEVERCTKVYST